MNSTLKEKEFESHKKFIYLFFIGILFYFLFFLPLDFGITFGMDDSKLNFFKIFLTILILFLTGYPVIKEGLIKTYEQTKKNRKLTFNVHILMILVSFLSFFMKHYNESILLIIIFGGAHFLEEYVENKNQKDIKKLLDIKPKKARLLKQNNDYELIDVSDLKIGDRVMVLNGEQIPSDGVIVLGHSSIDESAITGESIPLEKKKGDKVFGSNLNLSNTLIVEITQTEDKTIFSEIIRLTEKIQNNVSKKASFINKIAPVYIKLIIFAILGFIVVSGTYNYYFYYEVKFKEILLKSMIFLTVAAPCALAVADIPATLSAISNLAKKGVLLKNGKSLGILSEVQTIVFDKTGTLTQGKIEVKEVFFNSEILENERKQYLDILWTMEKDSNHPIAFSIQKYLKENFDLNFSLKLKTTNLIGVGIEAFDKKDNHYKIAKYNIFEKVPTEIEEKTQEFLNQGQTVIYFSHNDKIIMIITIIDIVRNESKEMIDYFNKNNVNTIMLTGDNKQVAEAISSDLNLNYVFYNCLPKDKVKYINEMKEKKHIVAMVGDGVNDSPALATSDISITLQEGSDVVIDIADIVLVKNDLRKIIYAHKLSKKLNKVVWQNIIFAFFIIIVFFLINIFFQLPLPIAVIAHEGSTLLVIFNCLRLRNDIE